MNLRIFLRLYQLQHSGGVNIKLADALNKLQPYIGKKFIDIFDETDIVDLRTNKGNVGQLLEKLIGLQNSSRRLDFDDGELKTNKAYADGRPKETMYIIQILSVIDELLDATSFKDSFLYIKIKNLVYVPVCKDGNELNWFFLPYVHVGYELEKYSNLYIQLEEDYYEVASQLNKHIKNSDDGFIHTSSGKYIQVRSKDSKPYSPIYSKKYNKYVSNKNHAFYFKKSFMLYLQELSDEYPL